MHERPPVDGRPAGIYLHFPFCTERCTYCDFATVTGQASAVEPYLASLVREIGAFQQELPEIADTVYLGGGTPSRMTPAQVGRVLDAVRSRFRLLPACEVTLEANPESLSQERLAGYLKVGITRVSVGVQSLDDGVLRRVGRAHDAARAERAVGEARAAGFAGVSLDLVAGLPGEDLSRWRDTVKRAASIGPDHVSVYLLETDKDTPLTRSIRSGRSGVADDDALAGAYEDTVSALEGEGLALYEISNFARPGQRSRHNLKYWTDGAYGGFGLGAHAYCRGARRANTRSLPAYLAALAAGRDPVDSTDPWEPRRRMAEALILGLRLAEGVDLNVMGERYGVDLLVAYAEPWERARAAGLVQWNGAEVRLTARGRVRSNELFADLI